MNTTPHDLELPSLTAGDLAFGGGGEIAPARGERAPAGLDGLYDVPVTVSAVLGHARMPIADLLRIAPGALLPLDRRVGEAVDIRVNDCLVARGEVVLVDDRLGVTLTEIILPTA